MSTRGTTSGMIGGTTGEMNSRATRGRRRGPWLTLWVLGVVCGGGVGVGHGHAQQAPNADEMPQAADPSSTSRPRTRGGRPNRGGPADQPSTAPQRKAQPAAERRALSQPATPDRGRRVKVRATVRVIDPSDNMNDIISQMRRARRTAARRPNRSDAARVKGTNPQAKNQQAKNQQAKNQQAKARRAKAARAVRAARTARKVQQPNVGATVHDRRPRRVTPQQRRRMAPPMQPSSMTDTRTMQDGKSLSR